MYNLFMKLDINCYSAHSDWYYYSKFDKLIDGKTTIKNGLEAGGIGWIASWTLLTQTIMEIILYLQVKRTL